MGHSSRVSTMKNGTIFFYIKISWQIIFASLSVDSGPFPLWLRYRRRWKLAYLGCRGRKLQPSDLDSGPAGLLVADGFVYGMASVSGQIWGFGIQKQVESGEKANLTFANTSNFMGLVEKRSSFIKICPGICVGNHLVPWFLINNTSFHGLGLSYRRTIKAMDLGRLCHLSPRWKNYAEIFYYVWMGGFMLSPRVLFLDFFQYGVAIFNFAASLQDNTRVTNIQVSLHRWVPQGRHFPTKFTWSRSGKTKVANGNCRGLGQQSIDARHWASALIPGWFVCGCAVLFGSDEKWKTCCFTMFQFYQNWNMQRVDREQVLSPLAELDGFAFCLSTATEEIYRMLESQNVKLYLVSQIFELFGKYLIIFYQPAISSEMLH